MSPTSLRRAQPHGKTTPNPQLKAPRASEPPAPRSSLGGPTEHGTPWPSLQVSIEDAAVAAEKPAPVAEASSPR